MSLLLRPRPALPRGGSGSALQRGLRQCRAWLAGDRAVSEGLPSGGGGGSSSSSGRPHGGARVQCLAGVALLVPFVLQVVASPQAFARKVYMPLPEAWRTLGVNPSATRGEIKKAFRQKIRDVHPDVTGDDGTMLQRVRDAFAVIDSLQNPTAWDAQGVEDGLPAWASGLLQGVRWTADCPSYAAFLGKPDQKALAVGEFSEKTGIRPWAAVWGKYSQNEANVEALRICRQHGSKCRLIYVGSGTARAQQAPNPTGSQSEREWWNEQFRGAGDVPGFGWMPTIDPDKEKLIGYKTVGGGDRFGAEVRVRVPVFRLKTGGLAYYYSPLRPKEKIHMKKTTFKHVQKATNVKFDPRLSDLRALGQQHNMW